MAGQLVPLVMAPRWTTYIGEGEFGTAPLDVSRYATAYLTFWRSAASGDSFKAEFQTSHDAAQWFNEIAAITTAGATDRLVIPLSRRWFRLLVTLEEDETFHYAAVTAWAVGSLELRVE